MNDHPIGIFDSGIGGTSIWKEIHSLLPNESTIYLADSKNAPYGEKSKDEIIQLCIKNTELLLAKGCKLVVVACNTATTNAIDYLRKHYTVPFIGIEPAIKPAALRSKSKKVGVLATQGTLSSSLFHSTTENHAAGIHIYEQVGTGLVPLIESNKRSGNKSFIGKIPESNGSCRNRSFGSGVYPLSVFASCHKRYVAGPYQYNRFWRGGCSANKSRFGKERSIVQCR